MLMKQSKMHSQVTWISSLNKGGSEQLRKIIISGLMLFCICHQNFILNEETDWFYEFQVFTGIMILLSEQQHLQQAVIYFTRSLLNILRKQSILSLISERRNHFK